MDRTHKSSQQQQVISVKDYSAMRITDDSKSHEFMFAKYKSDLNDVPAQLAAGSTLPLVSIPQDGDGNDDENYCPFEHRKVLHPTSDVETLTHLLKGSLGSGILAMPLAFSNAGLWFGLGATIAIGFICTYCISILVKCSHILCKRTQIPSLGFADIAEVAFLSSSSEKLHQYSRLARVLINTFLVVDLLGCCCVYTVFVATNIKQVYDHYNQSDLDLRLLLLFLLIPLILINLIRNLKYLTPFSMIANILIALGMLVTLYYILQDLPSTSERPIISEWSKMPMFFGTVIFALEGIGVVMSLENNMKNPNHFNGCPGVLNIGMGFVITMYTLIGFLGYLKYGEDTKGSITLNLPVEDLLAQSVKLMIAIAIFLTYSLQFYVPMEIIWKNVKGNFSEHKNAAEYTIRILLVISTVVISIIIPKLGPFITLIGAVCLSTLGLMFPAIIELVTYWERPGLGKYNWRIYKNAFLIIFGIIGFITGTFVSIHEMFEDE